MKTRIAVLIFIGSTMLMRADQLVERVQQALKDQGFYYGEVSGEMNANVTAAIRRYQIRNGLQVSGELNSETLKSLGIDSSASARPATKSVSPGPAAPVEPAERSPSETPNANSASPGQPFSNAPQDQQIYPSNPAAPGTSPGGGALAGTPFEAAPPPCNAMWCFRLRSRWPVVAFITKRLTDSMGQQWNLRCGLINREQGFA